MLNCNFRMPAKGKYIAGKQVSRWDADTDNVDIEYKNLDSQSVTSVPFFSGRKGCLLKVLFLLLFFSVGMILGYMVRRNIHETLIKEHCTEKPNTIKQVKKKGTHLVTTCTLIQHKTLFSFKFVLDRRSCIVVADIWYIRYYFIFMIITIQPNAEGLEFTS